MCRRDQFIQLAFEQSLKSPMSKKHGAVIVKNGKVLSTGWNRYNNRSMQNITWQHGPTENRLRKMYDANTYDNQDTFWAFANKYWGKSCCSTHAEIDAIIKAGKTARGATMYVVRYGGSDRRTAMSSLPCTKCSKACARMKITVFYSDPGTSPIKGH